MRQFYCLLTFILIAQISSAENCGQSDIAIQMPGFASNDLGNSDFVKIVDASTLLVKFSPTGKASTLETSDIVAKKAICLGGTFCFVARKLTLGKNITSAWEVYKKENPAAISGTSSRIYIQSEFPKTKIAGKAPELNLFERDSISVISQSGSTLQVKKSGSSPLNFSVLMADNQIQIAVEPKESSLVFNLQEAGQNKTFTEFSEARARPSLSLPALEAYRKWRNDPNQQKDFKLKPPNGKTFVCQKESQILTEKSDGATRGQTPTTAIGKK